MESKSGVSSTARNIAVIVAHGVGEEDPGYATTTLVSTLCKCADFRGDDDLRIRHLPDVNPLAPLDGTFPVVTASGQFASGERITFAELYWADLTNVSPGRIAAVLALFRIIFESHHFIDAMLDSTKDLSQKFLRHLLLIASWMLRGPIIGLVINTAALFWAALYVLPRAVDFLSDRLLFCIVATAVFLVSSSLLIWSVKRRDATWYDPISWTALIAAIVAVSFFGLHFFDFIGVTDCPKGSGPLPYCGQNYVDRIYYGLSILWGIWGTVILLCFIMATRVALSWRRRGAVNQVPRVFTALGVILLQFVLWTAILGTAVMPLLYRAEEVRGINELKLEVPSLSDAVELHPSAKRLLNVVAWNPEKSKWIDRVAYGYGFNGVMILCILLIGSMTQLWRYRLAKRSIWDKRIDAAKMPRIVIGRWILGVVLLVTFFQAMYLLENVPIWERVIGECLYKLAPNFVSSMGDIVTTWKHLVFGIGWVSTLALPVLVGARLGNPIHIARDLIDHEYRRRRASILTIARRSRDGTLLPRRARIQARLLTLLDEFVRKGRFDHVIFAVHSQGSVIAFDYLSDAAPENKELGGLKPDIVTFGSPLAHLYQHYFCEYGDLDREIITLRNSIGRWINLYRIDDYIGREIGSGSDLGVANEQIGPGGHTDYWREDRLARIILNLATARGA
jgi:hypothetical protein